MPLSHPPNMNKDPLENLAYISTYTCMRLTNSRLIKKSQHNVNKSQTSLKI